MNADKSYSSGAAGAADPIDAAGLADDVSGGVVEFRSLSKWYGEVIGLNDVSAGLGSGITGLVGPNGAGKSTLMALIMGQLRPSRGVLRVFGENPWNNPRVLSRIGFCPEGDPFWSGLTGYQFVHFLASLSGLRGRRARESTLNAIECTSMTESMNRPIRGYSKGMRQRIKLAQALVHEPELLILDEPFTGADPVARHELGERFAALAKQGVQIVISSHVLHEVEALTREIFMIDHGRLVARGDLGHIRGAMDERAHVIRVVIDQPRELAAELLKVDFVDGVKIVGASTVTIETRDPDRTCDAIFDQVLQHSWNLQEVVADDENLEALFGYLTEN